jgi:hypothetical protein
VRTPNVYGDTTWYNGKIVGKSRADRSTLVKIQIQGINQAGITTTTGEAEVALPSYEAQG